MKSMVLLPALLAAGLLLAACGTPAPATQSAPNAGSNVQAAASGGGTEVDVTLADNTIQSSLTTFKVGVPYRFVIINNGNHLHSFSINPPVEVVGSENALQSHSLLLVPQEKLPIGGGTTITFTFPASAAGQKLEFACLIPRHYEGGMRLPITVIQ